MLRLFQDILVFREANSSHSFRVTTSSQQSIFWEQLFWRRSFFRIVTSSQQLFFQNNYFSTSVDIFILNISSTKKVVIPKSNCPRELPILKKWLIGRKVLPSNHFSRSGSSLGQLLFGTATFLVEEMFRIKISAEELLFRIRYLCTASTHSWELLFGKN